MRRKGFTLVELLVVVAILATIAGAALFMSEGSESSARAHLASSELAEIRRAVLRFRADMGESPQYVAELLQSPDPADTLGGWWWRADHVPSDAPPPSMYGHDPATRRGWSGPYLRVGFRTGELGAAEGRETRIAPGGALETIDSDETATPPRRLGMILSEGQVTTGVARVVSDYRLDFGDANDAVVRNLALQCHPRSIPAALALGVKP